ncbi:unnamed protein product [Owenia fusiformis]|uniref:Uncharacterized protein n=1 Tax=Owenia fusiformis TaxID=6347 RepID=A0A8S4PWY1_OWEFU|nr:unnamed protein product [Owenia fusiformis]
MESADHYTEGYESDSSEAGDLGLGLGLRPGGIPVDVVPDRLYCVPNVYPKVMNDFVASTEDDPDINPALTEEKVSSHFKKWFRKTKRDLKSNNCSSDSDDSDLASTHKSQSGNDDNLSGESSPKAPGADEKIDALEQVLAENKRLESELDKCQKQLQAKNRAIDMLQKKISQSQTEHNEYQTRIKSVETQLAKEVNSLQFDVEYQKSLFQDSQSTWNERFEKLCQENSSLTEKINAKVGELKKVERNNAVLKDQRDELLELLTVQDQQKFQRNHEQSTPTGRNAMSTAAEMVTLGACVCHVVQDPCKCAMTAADLKKQLITVKEENLNLKKLREESLNTVDAYRSAFDDQLNTNKMLITEVADLAIMPQPSRVEKAKNVLTWIIKQLNEEEPPPKLPEAWKAWKEKMSTSKEENSVPNKKPTIKEIVPFSGIEISIEGISVSCHGERELIQTMLQLVHDKTEALAHSKINTKLFASRVKELEDIVSQYKHIDEERAHRLLKQVEY